jgi:hypothetical protein
LGRVASEPQNPPATAAPRLVFQEIWAYLLRGDEAGLTGTEPITDLCYFGVSLTKEGRITEAVARPVVKSTKGAVPRMHLVIAELSNDALMHFSLDPEHGVRPLLIDDICRVSESFDGVQIDFESVPSDEAEYFLDFLKALRSSLPAGRILSVAVPARTRLIADACDYSRIAAVADKLIVMAYDEHWSNSAPGPIASLPWCAKVADYSRGVIDKGKIVMGVPLYGRAWQDKRLSRALRFKNVQDIVAEKKSETNYSQNSEPGSSIPRMSWSRCFMTTSALCWKSSISTRLGISSPYRSGGLVWGPRPSGTSSRPLGPRLPPQETVDFRRPPTSRPHPDSRPVPNA